MCDNGFGLSGYQLEALSNLLLWMPWNGADFLKGAWDFFLPAGNVEARCCYSIIGPALQVLFFVNLFEESIAAILCVLIYVWVCLSYYTTLFNSLMTTVSSSGSQITAVAHHYDTR